MGPQSFLTVRAGDDICPGRIIGFLDASHTGDVHLLGLFVVPPWRKREWSA